MKLGHNSPILEDGTGVTITGATALTNLAGLVDGRPGTQDLFEWGSGDTVTILVSWERLITPGVAVLINVTGIPVGTTVECGLRRPEDASADYQKLTGEIVEFPNGDLHAVFHWPAGLDQVEAAEFSIIDDSSPAVMSEDDLFSIGEVFVSPQFIATIRPDINDLIQSQTSTRFSRTGQPWVTPAKSVREFRFNTTPKDFTVVYGDLQDTWMEIADNPRVFLIGSEELDLVRTSMYGIAEVGPKVNVSGSRMMSSSLVVREVR